MMGAEGVGGQGDHEMPFGELGAGEHARSHWGGHQCRGQGRTASHRVPGPAVGPEDAREEITGKADHLLIVFVNVSLVLCIGRQRGTRQLGKWNPGNCGGCRTGAVSLLLNHPAFF